MSFELYIPPERPKRNKLNGQILKGTKPHNTGKKWDDYLPKKTQRKILKNLKKITYEHLAKNHEAQQKRVVAIKDGKLIGIFRSGKVAQEKTGVPRSGICSACKGKLKTSGGYQWFYEEENDWIKHLNSKQL